MVFRQVFDRVFTFEFALAAAVFVLVGGFMTYGIVRFRARPGRNATQDTEHHLVEGLYAAGLLVVAIGIVVFTSQQNARDNAQNRERPSVDVVVTGFQWCWQFHYVKPSFDVSGDCQHGHYPTLVLPTNEPVRILTTSHDVIHSFWIPHFRYKMDAFPNHTNSFEMTIDRPGEWLGHCAEFCGLDHASMLFHLRAVPRAQFDQWSRSQAAKRPTAVSP